MAWEVRAEMKEGGEVVLRRGFPTRGAAEDHRVRLALWRRVWVQETPEPAVERRRSA